MPVSVAAARPSAPSSPSSRTSVYSSSYGGSSSRYSTLSRTSVTSLDLSSRYLSDRLSPSSLPALRTLRHGSTTGHSEDVFSLERRARAARASSSLSSSSATDSTSRPREREGSVGAVTKTRLLGLDSTSSASSASRLDATASPAYTGASSGSRLGRPPLHSAALLSSTAASADDRTAPGSTTYSRSRTTPTTPATMTTSTGKPFHSRFLKPKPVASEERASSVGPGAAGDKATPSSEKELARDEDDARNNNSILPTSNGAAAATDNGASEDDNGNENPAAPRPSVAALRQRFSAATSLGGAGAAPDNTKHPAEKERQQRGAGLGGHEDPSPSRHARLSASPGPGPGPAAAAAPDPDNFDSPSVAGRASSTTNGTHGSGLNGLRNIGNTCFMNSVIQCLSNTRPLLEYLQKQNYLSEINTTNSSMKGALIKAFAKMIEELWTGEGQVINTSVFKGQIQHFAPRFMGYSQQDAQEFLRYLLEGLHEDVNRVEHRPNTVLPDIDDALSDNQKAEESWRRYLRIDNSFVVDVFVGQLKSTLKCTVCGHCSVTFDPFWDLSLPIPSRTGQLRLHQCLEHFTREEVLDGDEKPTCAKCQTRRKCTKSFCIQKFPKILVLHLKRFSPMERFRGKLNVTVEFPLTGLDLSAYAANRGRGCTYNLYGIANHSGTTYSGHYTAYCKHPYTHEWHEYNDSRVSNISSRNIVSSEAYVLFYELSGHTSHL